MKTEDLHSEIDSDLMGGSADGKRPLLLRVTEVAALLGLGRSKVYEMVSAGELPIIRIGTAVRVPRQALRKWIDERTQIASSGWAHG